MEVSPILALNSKFILNNIIFLLFLFIFSIFMVYYICVKKQLKISLMLLSLCYHTFISIVFSILSLNVPADAKRYYADAFYTKSSFIGSYGIDVNFVVFTLYPYVRYFKLSYLSCSMLFNVIGFFGLVLFYMTLKEEIPPENKANKYVNLALFMPGLNFWSGMVGKDAYILFALGLVLYSLPKIKSRLLFLIIGLLLAAHIRPYVFMTIISCLLITILFSSAEIGFFGKFFILTMLILLTIPGYQHFLQEVKLDSLDTETAMNYFGNKQMILSGGGSDIDISNYNIIFKAFTFLYRPLFFDAKNLQMIISSIENLIYLILTVMMLRPSSIRIVVKDRSLLVRFSVLYTILGTFVFCNALTNLGTAVRIKNMLIITLLLLFLKIMAKRKEIIAVTPGYLEKDLSRIRTPGTLPPR